MNCPKCGFAAEDNSPDCPACGIIFARWRPAAPPVAETPPPSEAPEAQAAAAPSHLPAPSSREAELEAMLLARQQARPGYVAPAGSGSGGNARPLKLVFGGGLLLAGALLWLMVRGAKGLPGKGTDVDAFFGYEYTRPQGWIVVTKGTLNDAPRDFPPFLEQKLTDQTYSTVVIAPYGGGSGSDVMIVGEVDKWGLFPSRGRLNAARSEFESEIVKELPGAQVLAADVVQIDNIPAYRFSMLAEKSQISVRQLIYALPSQSRYTILMCMAVGSVRADFENTCNDWATSFRFHRRPDHLPAPLSWFAFAIAGLFALIGAWLLVSGLRE